MANEVRVRSSLTVTRNDSVGKINYASRPGSFAGNITGANGPNPGSFNVTVEGVDVDLSELTTPGYARISNLDTNNFFEYGIWDGSSFYPLGEVLPGESYVLRFSRNLTKEFFTGTGTTGEAINTFRCKADTASVKGLVEAFEA